MISLFDVTNRLCWLRQLLFVWSRRDGAVPPIKRCEAISIGGLTLKFSHTGLIDISYLNKEGLKP